MKLAMAQMRMGTCIKDNLQQTLAYMEEAKAADANLIFFPEVQLCPFFPQYERADANKWLMRKDGPELAAIQDACRKLHLFASPNVYLSENGKRFDASLMIDDQGKILGVSKMVHIAQAQYFYEQNYYTPSDTGFQVYNTPFGRIGIVICFDRHLPDGIRSCAAQGAELIIIPTANITEEDLELFAWEVRVQAFQNTVFVAMCNRVGPEGEIIFAGQSLLATPSGELLFRASDEAGLLLVDVPLDIVPQVRAARPWLTL